MGVPGLGLRIGTAVLLSGLHLALVAICGFGWTGWTGVCLVILCYLVISHTVNTPGVVSYRFSRHVGKFPDLVFVVISWSCLV